MLHSNRKDQLPVVGSERKGRCHLRGVECVHKKPRCVLVASVAMGYLMVVATNGFTLTGPLTTGMTGMTGMTRTTRTTTRPYHWFGKTSPQCLLTDGKKKERICIGMSSTTPSSSPTVPSASSIASLGSAGTETTDTIATTASAPSLAYSFELLDASGKTATDQWELDCYSRPVIVEGTGKKLWEVLITDSAGSFRFVQQVPSNQVNSKQLRAIVEAAIDVPSVAKRPSTIRFFRGAMFNMISIALQEIPDVTVKPSRCTFALSSWLEERHRNVYPNIKGYNSNMMFSSSATTASFLNVRTPVKLPDALRGEKYAFVSLPLAEFMPGGSVTPENIGVGRLCPLPIQPASAALAGDSFVQGIVILSSRASALATWLAGTEMVSIQADLRKRIVTMETDIDTQYLMAKLNDFQRMEAVAFEEGKDALQGLHFVSVQESDDTDPAGFWLLREPPSNI